MSRVSRWFGKPKPNPLEKVRPTAQYPVMLTHSVVMPRAQNYIFYVGQKQVSLTCSFIFSVGDYVRLKETIAYEDNGLVLQIETITQVKDRIHVYLATNAKKDELEKVYQYNEPLYVNADPFEPEQDELRVQAFNAKGDFILETLATEIPLPWTQLVQGDNIYSVDETIWDLTSSTLPSVKYITHPKKHTENSHFTGVHISDESKSPRPKLLDDLSGLYRSFHARTSASLGALESQYELERVIARLSSSVEKLRKKDKIRRELYRSFRNNFFEMIKLKNQGSIRQRLKVGMHVFANLLSGFSGLISLPGIGTVLEGLVHGAHGFLKKKWFSSSKNDFAKKNELEKMDIATDSLLEEGMTKVVYLYWEMMNLYQKIGNTYTNDIKTNPALAKNIVQDLLELEQVQKESREIIDVVLSFTQKMNEDSQHMDNLLKGHKDAALLKLLEMTD